MLEVVGGIPRCKIAYSRSAQRFMMGVQDRVQRFAMAARNRLWLKPTIGNTDRILWYLGWEPRILNIAGLVLAVAGWALLRNPLGLLLGTIALVLRWKTAALINSTYQERIPEAVAGVRQEGASRLGVQLSDSEVHVIISGRGTSPFGVKAKPEYDISVLYIADVFFAIYAGGAFHVAKFEVELPAQGEEIYFRHVSAINYQDPLMEVVLANGRTTRQFKIGTVGETNVLEALRMKLRSASQQPARRALGVVPLEPPNIDVPAPEPLTRVESAGGRRTEETASDEEERYCYLRFSKLMQLYQDPIVLDALIEKLEVPGKASVLKRLTEREKQEAIETQVDHFRRSPTSVWHGVPTYEVLAASIWRAQYDEFLPRRLVREIFARVSQEEDLLRPVSKWLVGRGYEPYMEVPLGRRRIDVLGHRPASIGRAPALTAVELKNEDMQFARGIDQMGTFAEYAHAVYLACTPAFCAEYLDRNTESRGVNHWDPDVLGRKLTSGGFGLLIVARDTVFEVLKPTERTPSSANIATAVNGLSSVRRVEC